MSSASGRPERDRVFHSCIRRSRNATRLEAPVRASVGAVALASMTQRRSYNCATTWRVGSYGYAQITALAADVDAGHNERAEALCDGLIECALAAVAEGTTA
jgi:hypothetical protein